MSYYQWKPGYYGLLTQGRCGEQGSGRYPDQNQSYLRNWPRMAADLIFWNGNELWLKFSCAQIWGERLQRALNRKNCFLLSHSIGNPKFHGIPWNQPHRSIGREDVRVFPFSPPNWSEKFKFDMYTQYKPQMCLLGVSTLWTHWTLSQLRKCGFSDVFLTSWGCSSHNFLPNWARTLKFKMYIY